jgi:hypothetical protein
MMIQLKSGLRLFSEQKRGESMAWYNEQSGFSLLEAVLVVGLVAMITIALGNFIIEQFDSWEVGTNQITSYDNNDLFITYLERDRKRAIAAYRNDDDQLVLQLDFDGDGDVDQEVKYYQAGNAVKRFSGKQDGLELDGVDDYGAIENLYYNQDNYQGLTVMAKLKTLDSNGIIYSFDRSEYFRFGIGTSSGGGAGNDGELTFNFTEPILAKFSSSETKDLAWSNGVKINSADPDITTINNGQEHIVTVVLDNEDNQVRMYIDDYGKEFNNIGVRDTFGSGLTRYGIIGTGSEASIFNGSKVPASYLKGNLYWIKQWDRALSTSEVRNHSSTAGLQFDYDFNQIQANIVEDQSSNQNDAVIYKDDLSNSTAKNQIVSKQVNNFEFSIANEQIEIIVENYKGDNQQNTEFTSRVLELNQYQIQPEKKHYLELNGSGDYSAIKNHKYAGQDYSELTLLAQVVATEDQGIIYSFDRSEYFRFGIGSAGDNGKLTFNFTDNQGTIHDLSGTTDVSDGNIHLLAVTFDHGLVKMYIDGQLEQEFSGFNPFFGTGVTRYGFMGTGSEAEKFNGDHRPEEYFTGQIHWLQQWNRALSQQEIKYYSSNQPTSELEDLQAYYNYINPDTGIFYDSANDADAVIFGEQIKKY